MNNREIKDLLYEQVARIGKALASPKRLELLEMLAQGERTVEALAHAVDIDIKLASAHLKSLRQACLIESRRDGKHMIYRLSGGDVAQLGVRLRDVAQQHLLELQRQLANMMAEPDKLLQLSRKQLMVQVKKGQIIMLDVRPEAEYRTAHLPHARSMPLNELEKRIAELPRDAHIVAYCRGPFCLMSDEAVRLLRSRGYKAQKTSDGVSEWLAAGLPLAA